MNETNHTTTLQVHNPSYVAGIAPLFTIIPSQILYLQNDLSPVTKHWIIGIDVFIILTALILLVSLSLRKVDLILKQDGVTFCKRSFAFDQIVKITYYQRTRNLKVQIRPVMRTFTVYLGNKEEAPKLAKQIDQWVHQTGVSYMVK